MDWRLFSQFAMTLAVAILGGWTGHYLSTRRDVGNERRKLRITYLLEAYRRLEGGSNRDSERKKWRPELESAISDIQLLGSSRQVSLARTFSIEMAKHGKADLDELIGSLRTSLRSELQLEIATDKVVYLRFGDENPTARPRS